MPRQLAIAALLLLGMAAATIEESFIHDDDGCVVETHCNACLLQLGGAGVVPATFSLPPVLALLETVVPPATLRHEEASPRAPVSRGPPLA
ncbi:MAG TPA: hypothetical protein VMX54_01115 [Vicinamibacteria bacterium]|nr:hypothetical protein [Vicinamibacteria bacterium]